MKHVLFHWVRWVLRLILPTEIPHQDITAEPLVPPADQLLSPTWEDIFFDSANIDTSSFTDGLYRFDLELLSQDGAGHFHVVSVARPTFQVSEANDILNSQNASQ